MKNIVLWLLIIGNSMSLELVSAHSGRTNSQGCHNQTRGAYHCHNSGSSQ